MLFSGQVPKYLTQMYASLVAATGGVDGATDDMALAAGLDGLLPHIKACANTFVDSLKLSASSVASLKASTVADPSRFRLLAAARADGLRAIDGPD